MKKMLLLCAVALIFAGCDSENEDKIKAPEKDGAIETQIQVQHVSAQRDSAYTVLPYFAGRGTQGDTAIHTCKVPYQVDVVVTTHKVWDKNKLVNQFTHTDTVPYLGTTKETGEDNDGNEKQFTVPKNYNLFITVK